MMKLDIISLEGKKVGDVTLSAEVFERPKRMDLLHRVVNWQLANARQGSAHTKIRSGINRTKSKWYRQKGTGRARHGARTANIFVGGATQFGPRAKDWSFSLNKKVRRLALKTVLSTKAADKQLFIVDEARLKSHKTKDLAAKLSKLDLANATFIVESFDENFDRASRNLPHLKVLPTEGANVYDILHQDKLVLTQEALKLLEARLAGEVKESVSSPKAAATKKAAPQKKETAAQQVSSGKEAAKTPAKKTAAKKAPAKKAPAKKTTAKKEAK
jgi:large subunit ribosomal protein L4